MELSLTKYVKLRDSDSETGAEMLAEAKRLYLKAMEDLSSLTLEEALKVDTSASILAYESVY